jgi:hypothetical protein
MAELTPEQKTQLSAELEKVSQALLDEYKVCRKTFLLGNPTSSAKLWRKGALKSTRGNIRNS